MTGPLHNGVKSFLKEHSFFHAHNLSTQTRLAPRLRVFGNKSMNNYFQNLPLGSALGSFSSSEVLAVIAKTQ